MTGISAALKGMRLRKDRTDVVRDLGKPIFIIIGKYDNAIKNSELIKKMEGVKKLSIYELETGHMGALEAPEECLEILQTWLKQNYK